MSPSPRVHTSPSPRLAIPLRALRLAFVVVLLGTLLSLAGLFFSSGLLVVEDAIRPADTMVVLGGDPLFRPKRAIELYNDQTAPLILFTGGGECETVQSRFISAGVPTNAIVLECASSSTWENAAFSIPILREHRATNVIIVTSWFHSRRALNCFRKQAHDLHFISVPTVADRPRAGWPNQYDRSRVLLEYAKLLVYWLRYGVCPW